MSYIDTKKKWNRIVACVMAVILSASMTISPLAAEAVPNTPKEEVVYVNLNTDKIQICSITISCKYF